VKPASGRCHYRAAEPYAFDPRMLPPQFPNQMSAVLIATRFANREKDSHET
jgi:hypothetical protein